MRRAHFIRLLAGLVHPGFDDIVPLSKFVLGCDTGVKPRIATGGVGAIQAPRGKSSSSSAARKKTYTRWLSCGIPGIARSLVGYGEPIPEGGIEVLKKLSEQKI